jgi:hypothetical protein
MSSDHLPQQSFELYVLDMLDVVDKARVEHHVAVCDRCASALAAEARAELSLQALVLGSKREAEHGASHFHEAVLARAHDAGPGEHRWSWAARTSMSAATLLVLVWSLGSVRLDTRYLPSRLPQEAELFTAFPSSSSEPAPSCEMESEELICRLAGAGAAPVDLGLASGVESRLENSCAPPTNDVCRAEDSAL